MGRERRKEALCLPEEEEHTVQSEKEKKRKEKKRKEKKRKEKKRKGEKKDTCIYIHKHDGGTSVIVIGDNLSESARRATCASPRVLQGIHRQIDAALWKAPSETTRGRHDGGNNAREGRKTYACRPS